MSLYELAELLLLQVKMKEGGRLLLQECMATAVADLVPNIGYSDLTPFFSISPLFCGPSDSDN